MNLVTIILKYTPQNLQFHFDQFKDADAILMRYDSISGRLDDLSGSSLLIEDDYGSKAYVVVSDISGIFLTDLSKEMEAHEIVDLAKLRKDMRVQKRRMEDPALRLMVPSQGAA